MIARDCLRNGLGIAISMIGGNLGKNNSGKNKIKARIKSGKNKIKARIKSGKNKIRQE
jgi:hypothetical protein